MAIRYEDAGFGRRPRDVLAGAFVLGREAPPLTWVWTRLTSLFDRGEPEERAALAGAVSKLVVLLCVGVGATTVVVVCIGAVVVRLYTGTFG
jgi:hypothetical protein